MSASSTLSTAYYETGFTGAGGYLYLEASPEEVPPRWRGAETVEVGLDGPKRLEPATPLLPIGFVAVLLAVPLVAADLFVSSLGFLLGNPDLNDELTPDGLFVVGYA